MGKITGSSLNSFKSAKYIYAKVKREWKNYGAAGVLDDADFPTWTAEVLKELGNSAFREEEALLFVKNGKASLPKDFMNIYAAYKCKCSATSNGGIYLQGEPRVFTDTTYDILSCKTPCQTDRTCDDSGLLSRVTIRQYVDDHCIEHNLGMRGLLKLSPNVKQHCANNCLNHIPTCWDEITINNGCIFANFKDEDIFLQYYAFPFTEDGDVMIPDVPSVEKAIEWYIKYQILLNGWLVGDITDVQNKWQKAEQLYLDAMALARYIGKLPAFSAMINTVRNKRKINAVAYFSQIDRDRY